jgi:hypothetical protein
VVVLDGIGKDIGLAFTVGLGVLLGTDHDGLGAVALVEEVDGGIELFQLPDLPGIDIEEILLQGTARRDAIDDDSGAFVLQALDEETVEQLGGSLHDGDGAVGGGDEPELLILPVLQQVFAEGIGADEDASGWRIMSRLKSSVSEKYSSAGEGNPAIIAGAICNSSFLSNSPLYIFIDHSFVWLQR